MASFSSIGQSLNIAVERFITIGEIIADENVEIKDDMYEAVRDARDAGKSIEHLCEMTPLATTQSHTHHIQPLRDYGAIVLAARSLLSSVTRILLLVDIVLVKKLLTAKRRTTESLEKLESVVNFTEFVRAFSMFGIEMVELACLTSHQYNAFKEERRRAQMFSARQILERSISVLLTSSKNNLVHSDCMIVKENRDTVFCQIRRAMDLIHFVVKDGIFSSCANFSVEESRESVNYENESIHSTIKYIVNIIESLGVKNNQFNATISEGNNNSELCYPNVDDENWESANYFGNTKSHPINNVLFDNKNNTKYTNLSKAYNYSGGELRQQLLQAFEKLFEKAHDFTDSPYISHENRKSILTHCDNCKIELNIFLRNLIKNEQTNITSDMKLNEELDYRILNFLELLCKHLVISVSSQMPDFYESLKMCTKSLKTFHALATTHDLDNLNHRSNRFHDYCDHIFDICKLLQHIAPTEGLQIQAKFLAINLRIYGPQVFIAAKILWKYPTSTAANENFEAFCDMWKWLTTEILRIAKEIFSLINPPSNLEKYDDVSKQDREFVPTSEEKDLNLFTDEDPRNNSDINTYQTKWNEDLTDNNDILKRAKNMSSMAFLMYQFTKGSGSLRTTQDLFTQAEYFAEEANRLYKVLRHFSYQVPASENKKDLLGILDRVPTFVQALQFTVKDHTVGKAATFVKVDHVIRETKNLMNVVSKVVSKCFECATKYKLNLTGITGGITSGALRGDENVAGGMGDSKGTTSSSEGSM